MDRGAARRTECSARSVRRSRARALLQQWRCRAHVVEREQCVVVPEQGLARRPKTASRAIGEASARRPYAVNCLLGPSQRRWRRALTPPQAPATRSRAGSPPPILLIVAAPLSRGLAAGDRASSCSWCSDRRGWSTGGKLLSGPVEGLPAGCLDAGGRGRRSRGRSVMRRRKGMTRSRCSSEAGSVSVCASMRPAARRGEILLARRSAAGTDRACSPGRRRRSRGTEAATLSSAAGGAR